MSRTKCKVDNIPLADGTGTSYEATNGVHFESFYKVVDVGDNSTTVYNGPAVLMGVSVNTTLSAHTCPITDAATTVITLPASWAAGSWQWFPGIRFETSLIVDPNDAGTGNITVCYRPL